jgi:hypothetical protein
MRVVVKQERLGGLADEFYFLACRRMGRRAALSTASKIAIAATTASLVGGLAGYMLGYSSKKEVTITKTPTISVEVNVEKSYNPGTKDYVVGVKVISPELDNLVAHFKNSSIEKMLDKNGWVHRENSYEASFSTGREIGEQRITLIFEKDGSRARKEVSIDIGLSEEEIAFTKIPRKGLNLLWGDVLDDEKLNVDREELFRYEVEIAKSVGMSNVSGVTSRYLKGFAKTLLSRREDYKGFLNGTSLVLLTLDSRPWVYYGNFTEDKNRAEFPLGEEEAYLLTRFVTEVGVDEEHLYAARATIDQLRTISLWLSTKRKVSPFDVVEYNGEKIQLWSLTKELFKKQMKHEKMGKRASVKDVDLIKRWSMREEINNRHIYYALRQIQLPSIAFFNDVDTIKYISCSDETYDPATGRGQPDIVPECAWGRSILEKAMFYFKKYVDRFEYFSEFLNNVVKNPDTKPYSPAERTSLSPKEMLIRHIDPDRWRGYFPNCSKEAYEDIYKTLLFNGSPESKYPIIAYETAFILMQGRDEERVEGGILYSSYLGYPAYRFEMAYPANTNLNYTGHGEISFLLNKEDESLLYERSKDRLSIERKHTHSLPFLWTRKNAILKDQEEKGEIRSATVFLPILHVYTYENIKDIKIPPAYIPVKVYSFSIYEF